MIWEKTCLRLKKFLFGNLNFQKGISNKNTNPILKDAIKMGGTELLRANLATGNALPWAIIMKINMSKCLTGNFFD